MEYVIHDTAVYMAIAWHNSLYLFTHRVRKKDRQYLFITSTDLDRFSSLLALNILAVHVSCLTEKPDDIVTITLSTALSNKDVIVTTFKVMVFHDLVIFIDGQA